MGLIYVKAKYDKYSFIILFPEDGWRTVCDWRFYSSSFKITGTIQIVLLYEKVWEPW